ncbi:hypothetical protein [Erwinia sp. 9145]|uniref:hypothetical protein n=1 Tax=Erwinia sp. 9145 TaxID=1500895 RepID=UPI000691F849|nr:hypothetical protein [Erwinia sp. 9145]
MNILVKKIFLPVMILMASFLSHANSFTGQWKGDLIDPYNNDVTTMTLSLKEKGGEIEGRYCLIYNNGNKTDCSTTDEMNIHGEKIESDRAKITFKSWFGGDKGKARITLKNDILQWHTLVKPQGENTYIPYKLSLIRSSDKYETEKFTRIFQSNTYEAHIINYCNNFESSCSNMLLMAITNDHTKSVFMSGKYSKKNQKEAYFFEDENGNKIHFEGDTIFTEFNDENKNEKGLWHITQIKDHLK